MITIVRKSEAAVRNIAETYIAANYITKDVSPNVSLAVNEATDHYETEMTLYNRIYYVIEGELGIKYGTTQHSVYAGDSCYIPANTTYDFYGSFKAVVVNEPAFGTR